MESDNDTENKSRNRIQAQPVKLARFFAGSMNKNKVQQSASKRIVANMDPDSESELYTRSSQHMLDVVISHSIHLYFTLIRFSIFKFTSYYFPKSFTLHSVPVWHLFQFVMVWLMWLASCLLVFT